MSLKATLEWAETWFIFLKNKNLNFALNATANEFFNMKEIFIYVTPTQAVHSEGDKRTLIRTGKIILDLHLKVYNVLWKIC